MWRIWSGAGGGTVSGLGARLGPAAPTGQGPDVPTSAPLDHARPRRHRCLVLARRVALGPPVGPTEFADLGPLRPPATHASRHMDVGHLVGPSRSPQGRVCSASRVCTGCGSRTRPFRHRCSSATADVGERGCGPCPLCVGGPCAPAGPWPPTAGGRAHRQRRENHETACVASAEGGGWKPTVGREVPAVAAAATMSTATPAQARGPAR